MGMKRVPITTRQEMMELRNQGITYEEIGHRFGLTKQRVYQILHSKLFARNSHVLQRRFEQGNKCSICEKKEEETNTYLQLDHNHTTGKLRGLLCPQCNVGLGMFQDNEALLIKAAQYLNAWNFT